MNKKKYFTKKYVYFANRNILLDMKLTFTFPIFVFAILVANTLRAQDVSFSQFNAHPMYLNPAMTGVYEGKFRLNLNYRNQYASVIGADASMKTIGAGADFRFFGPKNDYFGLGLSVMSDRAGSLGYGQTNVGLNFAYQKMLSAPRSWRRAANYLCMGAQLGYGQRRLDWLKARTSQQFDGDGYEPLIPTGENANMRPNVNYMNLNAGLMYYSVLGERKSYYFGASLANINRPEVSIFSFRKDYIDMRWTLHAGGEVLLGRDRTNTPLSLLPAFVLMGQGKALQTMFGAQFKYKQAKNNDMAFRFGGMLHLSETFEAPVPRNTSFIAQAGLEFGTVQVGVSYDANISKLAVASGGNGAFEVSLIYLNPTFGTKQKGCPAFN